MSVLLFVLLLSTLTFGREEQTAIRGRDAILPYQYPCDGVVTLLEWIRPDLESRNYVFFYRNARPYEFYQNPRYRGRVELTDPAMKGGDVSITVRNVSVADSGEYKCCINVKTLEQSESKIIEFWDVINLRVTDSGFLTQDEENEDEKRKDGEKMDEEKSRESVGLIAGVFAAVMCVSVGIAALSAAFLVQHKKLKERVPYEHPGGEKGLIPHYT